MLKGFGSSKACANSIGPFWKKKKLSTEKNISKKSTNMEKDVYTSFNREKIRKRIYFQQCDMPKWLGLESAAGTVPMDSFALPP